MGLSDKLKLNTERRKAKEYCMYSIHTLDQAIIKAVIRQLRRFSI